MLGMDATAADRDIIRRNLGLNDPVLLQYGRFLFRALHGEFGISFQFKRPAIDLITESLPATLELVVLSTIVSLVLGIPMGVFTALFRVSLLTRMILLFSVIGIAVPTFLLAIAAIYLFSVTLGWLSSYGRGDIVAIGGWTTGLLTKSGLQSLIMPTLTLAIYQLALILRLVRAEMSEILLTDYVRFARARGIRPLSLYFSHAFRNALIPVITVVGLQFGSLIGFSVVTEYVFQWPGMGFLFLQSIQNTDIPVLSAYMLIVASLIISINLVVDILYAVVDPRVREAR
jgi:peptide/nickel transport system permease protein